MGKEYTNTLKVNSPSNMKEYFNKIFMKVLVN